MSDPQTQQQADERAFGALESALASIDAADKECPVRTPKRNRLTARELALLDEDICPKCRATSSGNCGLNVRALAAFEEAVRKILAGRSSSRSDPQAVEPDARAICEALGFDPFEVAERLYAQYLGEPNG